MAIYRFGFRLILFGLLLCPTLSGCGDGLTDVTGQVNYNGKPLDKDTGMIVFFGPNGAKQVTAKIGKDGQYRAVGITPGENRVAIAYSRPIKLAKGGTRAPKFGEALPESQSDSLYLTPEIYASPETSELKVIVESNTVYNPKLVGPDIP